MAGEGCSLFDQVGNQDRPRPYRPILSSAKTRPTSLLQEGPTDISAPKGIIMTPANSYAQKLLPSGSMANSKQLNLFSTRQQVEVAGKEGGVVPREKRSSADDIRGLDPREQVDDQ